MLVATEGPQPLSNAHSKTNDTVNRLFSSIYAELQRMAARSLRRERPGHALDATALVHETYLRLARQTQVRWRDRAHIIGAAACTIRRILVDHARAQTCQKRRSGRVRVPLDDTLASTPDPDIDLIALNEAMDRLMQTSPRKAAVVQLRFFAGTTVEETAAALGVTSRSIERDWKFARAWLLRELRKDGRAARKREADAA